MRRLSKPPPRGGGSFAAQQKPQNLYIFLAASYQGPGGAVPDYQLAALLTATLNSNLSYFFYERPSHPCSIAAEQDFMLGAVVEERLRATDALSCRRG